MERIARHLKISGRVQGVCYRAWTQARAQERGLSGWVRNLPDGRVEVLLEGPEGQISAFIQDAYEGPALAQVSSIEIQDRNPEHFESFTIK